MGVNWVGFKVLIFLRGCADQVIEENAVNLVYGFVGLQNKFELDDFAEKRQSILIALVACCPQMAASYVC
jgi:hypothetical protein